MVRGAPRRAEGKGIGVSLKTPEKLRRLQEALYAKAKREPSCRFYLLYDKLWRDDVLAHASERVNAFQTAGMRFL